MLAGLALFLSGFVTCLIAKQVCKQRLLELPQSLRQRHVIDMRVDDPPNAWVQPTKVCFSSAPHLIDAWMLVDGLALMQHIDQQRFDIRDLRSAQCAECCMSGGMVQHKLFHTAGILVGQTQ